MGKRSKASIWFRFLTSGPGSDGTYQADFWCFNARVLHQHFAREKMASRWPSAHCCAQISQHFASYPPTRCLSLDQNQLECLATVHTFAFSLVRQKRSRREEKAVTWRAEELFQKYVLFSSLVKLSLQCILLQVWLLPSLWRLRETAQIGNRKLKTGQRVRNCLDTWLVEIGVFIFRWQHT